MQERKLGWFPILVAIPLLMFPALISGFPLMYPDSAGYIDAAVRLTTVLPRAMGYALFLNPFVQVGSLWPAILVQALVTTLAIHTLWLRFGGMRGSSDLLLVVCPLAALSTLSWTVSCVLPDIFTALVILSLGGLVAAHLADPALRDWPLIILASISSTMHSSNILLLVMLSISVLAVATLFAIWRPRWRSAFFQLAISVVTVVIIGISANLAINAAIHRKLSVVAPYGSGFALAAFNEGGLLKPFLETNCAENAYRLCDFKDALPDGSVEFLWNERSPFFLLGQFKGMETEARQIVIGIIAAKPGKVLALMWRNLISQLLLFDIRGMMGNDQSAIQILPYLETYGIGGLNDYRNSVQIDPRFPSSLLILIDQYTVIGSLLIIVGLLALGRNALTRNQISGSVVVLVGIVLNDLISGTLSGPFHRYQTRVA